MTLSFGSLCSGIGGIDLGLERAGMVCRWQSEIDPYAVRVLAKHWPETPRYGDLRALTGAELEPVDLVAAGFPCQPVSVAGKRRAQADARWLWPDIARLLCVVRPRFVLLENTPGLLIRGLGDVLGDLAEFGFDAEWTVLRAADFGAPHIRARVFLVASRGDGASAARPAPRLLADAGRGGLVRVEHQPWQATPAHLAESGQTLAPSSAVRAFLDQHGMDAWSAAGMDNTARLRGLGNVVVPQIAEYLGRRILEAA